MKKMSIYKIMAILITAAIFIAACTKESSEVKLDPKLSTSQVLNLTSDSVTIVGFVVASGDGFTAKGVCFNTDTLPTTANSKVVYSGDSKQATFNVKLKVNRLTKYHARAYATGSSGTVYGGDIVFTTPAALPTLASITASTLASTPDKGVTATTAVNISDDGGPDATADITARGVVYALVAGPTTSDSKTTEGTGKGEFSSLAANLKGNTKYYLRAYATNKIGTSYSNEVSFTTPVAYATINTSAVTKIDKTAATLNGVVTYNGGGTISERGFCYGSTENPTVANNKIPITGTKDSISYNLTGLTTNTAYHVRAYVINETGTNYGTDVQFTTLADITKFWLVGDATTNGWNNDDNAPFIISTVASAGAAEGYVYLKVGGLKLTTDHSWDNNHTFGDDGSGKLTNPGNNISVTTAGYYLVKANLSTMTYSLTYTTWGIIGDATAGGWGAQTDMVYDATTQTFTLAAHLTSGGAFKFRGTSDWGINYGSTAADGSTLDAGGSNIAVSATGDYAITLDLSHPNAYTYSANSWGVIGDATPGGWDTDTPMTWDATNKVFTATLTLKSSGAFKFRANAAWTVNLGGSLSALTAGGDNLTIATDGTYLVTLDPWALKATVTAYAKK